MTTADREEVLIAGAGPTGLLLAGDLAAAGVPVTVLERREHESPLSRAFAVHARTLETLDARGLADELIATGQKLDRMAMLGRARMELSGLPTRFPFVLITPQYQVERLLERRARALGAQFATATLVTDVRQDSRHVEVDTRTKAGQNGSRRASYLVGADGVHSTVRSRLGIDFPGHSVLTSVMLADVRLGDPPEEPLQLNANNAGLAFVAPFGDGWYRVIAWNRHRQVPDTEAVDLEEVRQITRLVLGSDFGMHDPRWMSRFHNDERQVPHYRAGRVFLAGDAAHVHSPAGGQGMNTGLQDAANLSWKLAAAWRGFGDDGLLDTYHAERYPVGKFVLRLSGGLVRVALVKSDRVRNGIAEVAAGVTHVPQLSGRGALSVSGLGISYPAERGAHPLAGKRMPDVPLADGSRLAEALLAGSFVLLTGGAQKTTDTGSGPGRVVVAARTRQHPRLILVRPDGYIAWATDEPDDEERALQVRAALTRWCGAPSLAAADM